MIGLIPQLIPVAVTTVGRGPCKPDHPTVYLYDNADWIADQLVKLQL